MRVHWYEGGEAFGERALDIGEEAVAETAALLGVTEDEPVDFFIYADQAAFYDALGPGTRENVGGQANADIRTLFALITPERDRRPVGRASSSRTSSTHLVFDTAVENPYHFPPRWLNEGLAVYLSEGYGRARPGDGRVGAAATGTLIPLDGLTGQFPTTRDGFFLAYAESVSAVDFLVRTHGQDALVDADPLVRRGLHRRRGVHEALGIDIAAFGGVARRLGAADPERPRAAAGAAGPAAGRAGRHAGAGPAASADAGESARRRPDPGAPRGPGGAGRHDRRRRWPARRSCSVLVAVGLGLAVAASSLVRRGLGGRPAGRDPEPAAPSA